MPMTFGGKAVPGTRAATVKPREQANPVKVVPESSPDDVLIFLHLVARSLEARRELWDVVAHLREIDIDALHDPALEDHPRRPAMLALHEDRIEAEKQATIRLMECNAALSRQWDGISPQEKHRYALTSIVGEPDPQYGIIQTLWCSDRGLALLVPFPEHWSVPWQISHRVFDDAIGVKVYDIEEVMNSEQCPF